MGTANSRPDTYFFTPATLSFTKQKGTAFLLSSSQSHNPFAIPWKGQKQGQWKERQ